MTTNEYLQKTYKNGDEDTLRPRPIVRCADGFSISIQASKYTCCNPRSTYPGEYTEVELGYPSEPDELIEHMEHYEGSYKKCELPISYRGQLAMWIDKL